MDDIIFEEFKGTGNQELQLSRTLAERRIFPAVDLKRSGTRKEELLLAPSVLESVWKLRRAMGDDPLKDTEQILKILKQTKSNTDFCEQIDYLEVTK